MSSNIINHDILDHKNSMIYHTEDEPSLQQVLKCWTYNIVADSRYQKYKPESGNGLKIGNIHIQGDFFLLFRPEK